MQTEIIEEQSICKGLALALKDLQAFLDFHSAYCLPDKSQINQPRREHWPTVQFSMTAILSA